jgi:hypothetical protein
VPPEGTAVRLIDCPLINEGEAGDIVAVRAGLTTNSAVGEVTLTGGTALSMTTAQ